MGQDKVFINYSLTRFVLGVTYRKRVYLIVHIGWFQLGIGLTSGAKGFGFWQD